MTNPVLREQRPQTIDSDQRNVPSPLPQWQQLQLQHVDAEVQVAAKPAGLDLGLQIHVRGKNQATTTQRRLHSANTLELPRFHHPQQLRLIVQSQQIHFINQQRPLAGSFNFAGTLMSRPGKCPPSMPEELRMNQVPRHRSAGEKQKRLVRSPGPPVNGLSNRGFARARLARQQNWHPAVAETTGCLQHLIHRLVPRAQRLRSCLDPKQRLAKHRSRAEPGSIRDRLRSQIPLPVHLLLQQQRCGLKREPAVVQNHQTTLTEIRGNHLQRTTDRIQRFRSEIIEQGFRLPLPAHVQQRLKRWNHEAPLQHH